MKKRKLERELNTISGLYLKVVNMYRLLSEKYMKLTDENIKLKEKINSLQN